MNVYCELVNLCKESFIQDVNIIMTYATYNMFRNIRGLCQYSGHRQQEDFGLHWTANRWVRGKVVAVVAYYIILYAFRVFLHMATASIALVPREQLQQ